MIGSSDNCLCYDCLATVVTMVFALGPTVKKRHNVIRNSMLGNGLLSSWIYLYKSCASQKSTLLSLGWRPLVMYLQKKSNTTKTNSAVCGSLSLVTIASSTQRQPSENGSSSCERNYQRQKAFTLKYVAYIYSIPTQINLSYHSLLHHWPAFSPLGASYCSSAWVQLLKINDASAMIIIIITLTSLL